MIVHTRKDQGQDPTESADIIQDLNLIVEEDIHHLPLVNHQVLLTEEEEIVEIEKENKEGIVDHIPEDIEEDLLADHLDVQNLEGIY